jgi:trigger factor
LRAKLRRDSEGESEKQAEVRAKNKLAEKLIEAHPFPVPEVLVEAQLDRKLERVLGQLLSQGIDPRQTEVDWKKVREDSKPEAEKEVRLALMLNRVAEAEKIAVAEEEVDEVIREMAQARRMTAAELKTRLTGDGKLDKLKTTRRNQKALDFIYRNAKIIRKNAEPAGPGGESP